MGITKVLIRAGDDSLAGFESIDDLKELRILTAESHVTARGTFTVGREDIDRSTAGRLEKGASGYHDGLSGLAKDKVDRVGLPHTEIAGRVIVYREIGAESAVSLLLLVIFWRYGILNQF